MKKSLFILCAIILISALSLIGCGKEPITGGNSEGESPVQTDSLAGRTYVYDYTMPYHGDWPTRDLPYGFYRWLDTVKYIHSSDNDIDSIRRQLSVSFNGAFGVSITENLTVLFSKAIRYIGTEEHPTIYEHREDWQKFDTTYYLSASRDTTGVYLGQYPHISFDIDGAAHHIWVGAHPDFTYQFMYFDADRKPYGEFLSPERMNFYFTYECNGVADTILRPMVRVQ